jgi:hypothetical protein
MEETKVETPVEQTEVETKQEESVKTFTQEEVNELLGKEKSRLKKGMPSKEELDAFNEWKESQKTEQEKQQENLTKISNLEKDKIALYQENLILKKGVKPEDVDYIQFKVSKMDGDFEENLDSYLADNSKFTKPVATGTPTHTTSVEKESGVAAILKAKHPDLF